MTGKAPLGEEMQWVRGAAFGDACLRLKELKFEEVGWSSAEIWDCRHEGRDAVGGGKAGGALGCTWQVLSLW